MKKKEMKKRIKELEAENLMLRAMASYPVYIYLYQQLPYNPWWEYQPYRLPQPIWVTPHNRYFGASGTNTFEIDGSWQTSDTYVSGTDWAVGNSQTCITEIIGQIPSTAEQ